MYFRFLVLPLLLAATGCAHRSEIRGTLRGRQLEFTHAVHTINEEGCLSIWLSNRSDYCDYLDEKHQFGEKDAPEDLHFGVCKGSWEEDRGSTPVGTYEANAEFGEMRAEGVLTTVTGGKELLHLLSSGFVRLDEVGGSTVVGFADVRFGGEKEPATLVGPFTSHACR